MHFGASAVGADGRRRDAGVVTRSLHTAQRGYARRSRLASVPGDPSKVYRLLPDRPLQSIGHFFREEACSGIK